MKLIILQNYLGNKIQEFPIQLTILAESSILKRQTQNNGIYHLQVLTVHINTSGKHRESLKFDINSTYQPLKTTIITSHLPSTYQIMDMLWHLWQKSWTPCMEQSGEGIWILPKNILHIYYTHTHTHTHIYI